MILRQSNIEVLKGVRRLKAIPPNFAVKNPTEKHIWKFAVSVVDTISIMPTVEQRKLIPESCTKYRLRLEALCL